MWLSIANIILRNRFTIIGILTLLTVFFGYQATSGLKLDNKYGILLPDNAEAKLDHDRFIEMFGEDGGALIIGIETDSLYTEENFLKWKELSDSILTFDGVESVVSEATLFTISNNTEAKKFEAHKVFSDTKYGEKSIDSIKAEIKNNPLFRGLLYNEDDNVSLIIIGVNEEFITDQVKAEVVLNIEALADSYSANFGKPKYAGLPHLRVVIAKQVMAEMYIFIGLLLMVTSLLIYIFFRSFRVVLICNLVVIVAVIWSIGSIGTLGYNLTIIMALIPPLMIVIGIPNCLFLMTKYHQEVLEHGNKILALTRVIKKIGTATLLTNFTTALGFLTFVTTRSPKLMEFGITAAINIMLVFVISICILPIILSLSKPPKPKHLKHLERKMAVGLLNKLVDITVNHRRWVYICTIGIVLFSILGMMQIKATGNLTGDLPEDHQILKDFNFLQDNFGGSIPFEIMIDYKEPSRIGKASTLERVEAIQNRYAEDTLFSKFISYVDFLKAANMAYHNNDSTQFVLVTKRRKLAELKRYLDSSVVTNSSGVGVGIHELLDTTNCVLRIRSQIRDIGSYEISDIADSMEIELDEILNPDKKVIEEFFIAYSEDKNLTYVDSIIFGFPAIYNSLTKTLSGEDEEKQLAFDMDSELIKTHYEDENFESELRAAIDNEYFDVTLTGTAIVASNGTQYMVLNLFTSLLFAILAISILMAILFRSSRMVLVSLIPNFIPLLFTAGIMGWFGIPLKPSTLLVFSIAFGISVDDTIHYLAKYRQELKTKQWDLKQCVIMAIREAGLGMFYTSIVLFCGFSMFSFSQFGGTKALGLLVSLTLLIAMITNLVVLPTLLLSLERRLTTKSFEEPYFDAYAEESDIDWDGVDVKSEIPQKVNKEVNEESSNET
ncbi:MAG: MMPL family transporter [Crocinitomicaceae bacterium]|nr:MMPL family transporter [Crocinitomicaceae bacterium]